MMESWLKAALGYVPLWLDYQMRQSEQPGCVVALAHKGRLVFESAFGVADQPARKPLTPRHRFRVASHSKSFTAAAILKLREQGRIRLDDPVGTHVDGLHPMVAEATPAQLLSHSAGLIRDGTDAGQWLDRRPFLGERALRAALAEPPVIAASTRLKYSNHGYGLLGLVIEAVTGEPYRDWVRREIVAASGLRETEPDGPAPRRAPVASGHSRTLPLGRRVVIPGDNPTHALAPATGFVSTAGDLARFYASLDPAAKRSVLTPASRREMIRRQWHDAHATVPAHYGLGIMIGTIADWPWFGHAGSFQGFLSRTMALPDRDISVSIVTNAIDGPAASWANGVIGILQAFAERGAPGARTRAWAGRWWSIWRTLDLVAMRDHVVVANPSFLQPFADATEITVTGADSGKIRLAGGLASHGEDARLVRRPDGRIKEIWLGGTKYVPEARAAAELKRKYDR